ncbi:putative ABC transport system permease protein [Flagellimonas taeanensis]|uniref:ABC transport system permease protein n=1 Tax=Flagellimonas taeanensis TaxID=1005926 RepID=A0A1M6Q4W9_9FLAO|nr:ABC transporter permease [Allomuricauda taeanensis]SFB69099.1 putative ABC transport system permease protein [Allomuricauda taeanensis]SHK15197.1 putative ABC transport system permease protein [Allomuricauda taeanensis]
MFKNHLRIAWRNIKKDKLFTTIKIGGFAVGIAACLLIALFIKNELSYDVHYKNKNRIYRVVMQGVMGGEQLKSVHFQLPFAETLEATFPEVLKAGKINTSELFGAGRRPLRAAGTSQNNFEDGFIYADQQVFDILELELVEGTPENLLTNPGSIVMTAQKAAKYFPEGNAVGKTVYLDDNSNRPYTVTGVIQEDLSKKSHLDFDFLLAIEDTNMSWSNSNYFTYLLLDDKAEVAALEKKMGSILEQYVIPAYRERMRGEEFMEVLKTLEYKLQPVGDIHLRSDAKMGDGLKHGDIRFVWLFAAIAGFVLLLAVINFINLSTAKSANRAKEVGLKKTVGAFRSHLVSQFLTESVIYSLISFVIGVFLAWLLLPTFNVIAAKNIVMPWSAWWFLPTIAVAALLVGIMAGLYPAFYLSAFKPVNVLKGTLSTGSKSGKLRSGLVVVQFTTSVVLIIGTLIIYNQMNFILDKKLGFNKDQVLVIKGTNLLKDNSQSFKERLLGLSDVKAVSISDYLPIEGTKRNGNTFGAIANGRQEISVPAQIWRVDHDYINTLGLQLKEGRGFSKDFASDSSAIVINSTMAKELGFDDPIGKRINNGEDWTIIGVLEDFHFKNLKEDIAPVSLVIGDSPSMVSVKLSSSEAKNAIRDIQTIWQQYVPQQAFEYTFLDQEFAHMHDDVQRMGKIFNSFALFAIFVACLGLFALSAFLVEQRKKEISIRLVLGAPFKSIYQLLTMDFMKLIMLSIIIAIPIGWYMMNRWLEDFAYRIHISWGTFLLAGLLSLLIALLTVSFQSIRAALTNPAKTLKAE